MINTPIVNFILGALLLYNLSLLADTDEPDVKREEFAKSELSNVHGFFDLSFKLDLAFQ